VTERLQEKLSDDDADAVGLQVRACDGDHEHDRVALCVREAVDVRDGLREILKLRLRVCVQEMVRFQLSVWLTDRVGVHVGEGVSTSVCERLALGVRLAVPVPVPDVVAVPVGSIVGEPVRVAERERLRDGEALE